MLLALLAVLLLAACGHGYRSASTPSPTATQQAASTANPPAGRLLYVPAISEYNGARHLSLSLRNADGSGDRALDGNLDGTDGTLTVIRGTQKIVYAHCESSPVASSCRPRIRDVASGAVADVHTAHLARSVAVSPDGSVLAYASGSAAGLPGGDAGIYTSRLDGSDERLVYRYPNAKTTIYGLAWSPDGTRLAFIGGVASADPVIGLEAKDTYVIPIAGGTPVQAGVLRGVCDPLNAPDAASCQGPIAVHATADRVVWSADSSTLLVSGRTASESGDVAGVTPNGDRIPAGTPQAAVLDSLCHPGRYPGICMLTNVLPGGKMGLVRLGGRNLLLVSLERPGPPVVEYHLDIFYSLNNAIWLPAS